MMMQLLMWCHHIHHNTDGTHTVHHCGGDHFGAQYTISHCKCGFHCIDQEYIRSDVHAVNEIPVILHFTSKCHDSGGWHVESAEVIK